MRFHRNLHESRSMYAHGEQTLVQARIRQALATGEYLKEKIWSCGLFVSLHATCKLDIQMLKI